MDIKFTPLSNYVVFDFLEKKDGSRIVIPDKRKLPKDRLDFVVVAIGENVKNIKVGDKILPDATQQEMIQVVHIGKKEFGVMRESQILGILQEGYEKVGGIVEESLVN